MREKQPEWKKKIIMVEETMDDDLRQEYDTPKPHSEATEFDTRSIDDHTD